MEKANKHKAVLIVAKEKDKIIATAGIDLKNGRQNHIGEFGIAIRKGYRGIGLGSYLTGEIIKLAKKELKPKPKILLLEVFSINKPAINLYKKFGFRIVVRIPEQIQYKGKLITEIIMIKRLF